MLFHYALVDDLITKEEFEKRVEQKIYECGDLIDEPTAAMLVIGELGRQHVKCRDLSGKSSLFSFFGKVIDKTEPREFDRNDGEKGWVATILLGDETGTARVVLWDEKAGAALEIAIGDVLEVIGRHPGRGGMEIYALALRKAGCEITCAIAANGSVAKLLQEPVNLDVVLIGTEPARTFNRRDGTTGEMVEAIVGDAQGTARLVTWAPDLLAGIPPGVAVHVTAAKPNDRNGGRSYSIDEKSTVSVTEEKIEIPFAPISSVSDSGNYSVQGEVKSLQEPRAFTSRDGSPSWVRNILLRDSSDEIRVALWGEKALFPIHAGDRIRLYHVTAKPGRFGIELSAGRGSILIIPDEERREIVFCGTIIAGSGCTIIDNGIDRYLIEGNFPHGHSLRVTGILAGNRLLARESEPVERTVEETIARIFQFRERAGLQ